ncbi:response regulator transcription factor [Microbacterium panaciterrae]|uniref:HTH luxR-type domain-containing protein n=1 Tax=Microbacterium panaciterrae TaxID=985759 RepID=A0ABP8P704_9MICO
MAAEHGTRALSGDLRGRIAPVALAELIGTVIATYDRELTEHRIRAGVADSGVARRDARIAGIVTDIVDRFRVVPPEAGRRQDLGASADAEDSPAGAEAAMLLFRILAREITAALNEDPIEVSVVVMARFMDEVVRSLEADSSEAVRILEYREELDAVALHAHVTPREAAIFQHLVSGAPRLQIAAELHLSPRTVKNYVNTIGKKLGAQGRSALLQRARELQILVLIPVVAVTTTISDVIAAASTLT